MPDPLAWIDDEAGERARRGLVRSLIDFGEARPGRIDHAGRTLLNFASNDYLGLAADPRLADAAHEAATRFGWGSGASALVCGWREPHEELARELAEFEGAEAVALFPTGFAANAGAIAALVGPGDAVFHDRLNHACLFAGTKMAGASVQVYPHADAERLAALLSRRRQRFRRVLLATDGVFSMDGDLAPLADLVAIAERFEAMLLVDEAHGTGAFGPDGRGAASECGVADRVPIRVGTLSKALGSIGGFVAGSRRLVEQLVNAAPTLLYSTSLPPAAAAAARAALRIVAAEPERRRRAHRLADDLRRGLVELGFDVGRSAGPIVPAVVGEAEPTMDLAGRLHERGFLVAAIRPPTVPAGAARLRISVTAAHDEGDVGGLLGAIGSRRDPSRPR